MWIDLQGLDDADEQQRGRLAAVLPDVAYRLLVEPDASSEAPLDGSRLPEVPLPSPEEFDLRKLDRALFETARRRRRALADATAAQASAATTGPWPAARSADGGALVANDMHLGLRVPNIWYRARLVVAGGRHRRHRREPARRAGDHRRQQRPRRLGIHQQLRRLPGPRPRSSRDRASRAPT